MTPPPPASHVLARDGFAQLEVKKSRFLGYARPIESTDQAAGILSAIRKEHFQARHHCTAMIVGDIERSNDDGEPAGTAGAPMLQVLRGRGLTGVCAVVVRYFGGTLLGTGGLIRAYGQAVSAAVEDAGVLALRPVREVTVTCSASDAGRCEHAVRRLLAAHGIEGIDAEYGERATLRATVPAELADVLAGEIAALAAGAGAAWPVEIGAERMAAVASR